MKIILNPGKATWNNLVERPIIQKVEMDEIVKTIFDDVRRNGDKALYRYTRLFDQAKLTSLKVSQKSIDAASLLIPDNLKSAINLARVNIQKFHSSQIEDIKEVETTPGVTCWRESRAIETIGVYIPGGSAPLFSTILMVCVPAILAGCKEIVLCTPPGKNGLIDPAILYTANMLGVTNIYSVGGIQAIAAMAMGTESIPRVDKIFGPGNQYVTAAKQKAFNLGVAIDMPAGPSEVLVIADKCCNPSFVAADLLSQAEHGRDSQVMLVSDNESIVKEILQQLDMQLLLLPRKAIAEQSLTNSKAIVFNTINECIDFSNAYAPEHLILALDVARKLAREVTRAGSVFLGNYSCESAGDYASGTNHTLPTNGFARSYSGLSIDSFVTKITFQELTLDGIKNIGPAIELMADAEQLAGHKNAVTLRLTSNQ